MKVIIQSYTPQECKRILKIQSYTPQECKRIINGRQTIKVCKNAPKDTPFKVYIYCTKDGYEYRCRIDENGKLIPELWNGKVIGEYVCEKVDKYRFSNYEAEYDVTHDEMSQMWLNHPNLITYGKGKTLRGLHVSSLKIYDKPKELKEFNLTRPPHGWQYVEEEE